MLRSLPLIANAQQKYFKVGIDLGTKSLGMCIVDGEDVEMYCYSQKKPDFKGQRVTHLVVPEGNYFGIERASVVCWKNFGQSISVDERISEIVDNILEVILQKQEECNLDAMVVIENYAYSKRSLTDLMHLGGHLRASIAKKRIKYKNVPPTTVKKFMTGKGNADKALMYENFVKKTGVNLFDYYPLQYKCRYEKKGRLFKPCKPVEDLVDAFAIAMC